MQPLTALIATQHIYDLQREADLERLARLAQAGRAGSNRGGPNDRGALSRLAGRSARALSVAFDGVASRIDPVEDDSRTRPLTA